MVIIRSVEPGRGSSMVMLAPESPRILRIRAPPLPMIAPANWNGQCRQHNITFSIVKSKLTSFGMETWVVSVWPRSSSRKILSSWYILQQRDANEFQNWRMNWSIEMGLPAGTAGSATDRLADAHQRRRWQVTFITASSVTMSGRR